MAPRREEIVQKTRFRQKGAPRASGLGTRAPDNAILLMMDSFFISHCPARSH